MSNTPRKPNSTEVHAAARDPRFRRALAADTSGEWRTRGVCRSLDPETFFPLPTEPSDDALFACGRCVVADQCLAAALNAGDQAGVWGATTPRERRAMLVTWRQRVRAQR